VLFHARRGLSLQNRSRHERVENGRDHVRTPLPQPFTARTSRPEERASPAVYAGSRELARYQTSEIELQSVVLSIAIAPVFELFVTRKHRLLSVEVLLGSSTAMNTLNRMM
jgi:hypothetical protein